MIHKFNASLQQNILLYTIYEGLPKNSRKFYKFETLVPFKELPPVTGCSDLGASPIIGNIV